jgi:hypothetical protein
MHSFDNCGATEGKNTGSTNVYFSAISIPLALSPFKI